jgi:PAS domain-containing protein
LLDLAPVGLIVRTFGTDAITSWSGGAEELSGWTATEALGRVTHDLLRAELPTVVSDGRFEGAVLLKLRRLGLLAGAQRGLSL